MSWQSEGLGRGGRGAKLTVRTIAVLLGVTVVIGVGAYSWAQDKALQAAAKAERVHRYTISGPPCPTLTAAEFDALATKPGKAFVFRGVGFARQYGHADCGVLGTDNPEKKGGVVTCHFSGPAVVTATTDHGTFYFRPGVGYPATVSAGDGPARCVLASRFTYR